eukprot:CAMPEP_0114133174 /NCGR_PEP_ID=MMETSP0043_2-20121206/13485_1 /TAXON_ID=464988 /ORGANISM="Hemiselmis andersenii, Strain CCMP644" /LENGTH=74 /DNA_ID=CAMNT_0001226733 /DNA_START=80 /DNA_END=301 /DNA_ORIENTATION=+
MSPGPAHREWWLLGRGSSSVAFASDRGGDVLLKGCAKEESAPFGAISDHVSVRGSNLHTSPNFVVLSTGVPSLS